MLSVSKWQPLYYPYRAFFIKFRRVETSQNTVALYWSEMAFIFFSFALIPFLFGKNNTSFHNIGLVTFEEYTIESLKNIGKTAQQYTHKAVFRILCDARHQTLVFYVHWGLNR